MRRRMCIAPVMAGTAQRRWILTALGDDRPGMVAGVSEVLFRLGCNLEDSAMTRLAGQFTIMLAFAAPAKLSAPALERAFASVSRRFGLAVHLKAVPRRAAPAGQSYLISVYGADRPGIVYHVSHLLAGQRVNIIDVSTHLTAPAAPRRARRPLYLLILEVQLPSSLRIDRLEERLRHLGKRLGVEIGCHAADTAVL